MKEDLAHFVKTRPLEIRIQENVSPALLTTFGVGAPVPFVLEPVTGEGLANLLRSCQEQGVAWRMLGAGSNVLLPDSPLKEILIRFGRKHIGWEEESEEVDGKTLFAVLAGTPLMRLSRELSAMGYSGLEFAAGIPASVGGATRMNAGAHGSSMQEILDSLALVTSAGEREILTAENLRFCYRNTEIPEGSVIGAVQIALRRGDPQEILSKRASCLDYRKQTQPLHLPSAGSVFKNPGQELELDGERKEFSAARLLEEVGMKGKRIGGVSYSELHANWLVRDKDSGTASDVKTLIELGQEAVVKHFSIELQPEICFW